MGSANGTPAGKIGGGISAVSADSFPGLIGALLPDLRRLAWRLTALPADAADLTQATCLRALEKRSLFVRGSAQDLRKWVSRIMTNLHRDQVRRRLREVLLDRVDDIPALRNEAPAAWTQVGDEAVRSAMQRLRPPLRDVYTMRALQRLSYSTISARLHIPETTAATRMFRARRRLREMLVSTAGALPPPTPIRGTERPAAPKRAIDDRLPARPVRWQAAAP